jgi:hypothetical protein
MLSDVSRCGFHAHIQAFFRQNRTTSPIGHVYVAKHAVCVGCELSARNVTRRIASALPGAAGSGSRAERFTQCAMTSNRRRRPLAQKLDPKNRSAVLSTGSAPVRAP